MSNDLDHAREVSVLETVDNAVDRNALALRLAETKHPDVLPVLLGLIARPTLVNSRATIVRCLGFYELSDHFELLVDLLINGNWEVAHEAHALLSSIEELKGRSVDDAFEAVANIVRRGTKEEWRQALLQDVLKMFE